MATLVSLFSSLVTIKTVEPRGIEPRFEPCKGPVLPLNYGPIVDMAATVSPQVKPSFVASPPDKTRTPDFCLAKAALYQLS